MRLTPFVLFACSTLASMSAAAVTSVNLADYRLVGRYALPEPTRVSAPAGSLLAQEVSAVTWNRDTNTLFMIGDGSRSVVQVSLTGVLIDSMTLGLVPTNPQGTAFYDTEGLTYIGNNKFVLAEERYRTLSQFTYAAGTTLTYAGAQQVKLGTTVGNVGIEGLTYDPRTSGATPGFIAVKEINPMGVFQTNVDFAAGSATNGSAITVNSQSLFDPAKLAGHVTDLADVYALSNLGGIGSQDRDNLLLLSQESGKVLKVDRAGNVLGSLSIPFLPTSPLGTTELGGVPAPGSLNLADQQHEGLTMDDAGRLYIISENGGGDSDNPQLWVFAPVPEPGAYALMLGGLGLLAVATRRKSRKAA